MLMLMAYGSQHPPLSTMATMFSDNTAPHPHLMMMTVPPCTIMAKCTHWQGQDLQCQKSHAFKHLG